MYLVPKLLLTAFFLGCSGGEPPVAPVAEVVPEVVPTPPVAAPADGVAPAEGAAPADGAVASDAEATPAEGAVPADAAETPAVAAPAVADGGSEAPVPVAPAGAALSDPKGNIILEGRWCAADAKVGCLKFVGGAVTDEGTKAKGVWSAKGKALTLTLGSESRNYEVVEHTATTLGLKDSASGKATSYAKK